MNILDFNTVDYLQFDTSLLTFSGTLESEIGFGGQIAITIGNYDRTYYVEIDPATGSWSWTSPVPLADGEYSVSIQAIDLAGNVSDPTLATLIVDTTPPVAPTLINMFDDQGSITGSFDADKMTDDRRPKLTGIAEKGSLVYLKEGNSVIGSALADKTTGLWTLEPNRDLSDGRHDLTLFSSEIFAGKTRTGASSSVTIIIGDDIPVTPEPAGPAIITHALDNVGSATGELKNGALTDDTTPELRGTAPVGSTVRIQYRAENGSWLEGGTATLNGTNWTWQHSLALTEGKYEFRANAGSGWSDEFQLDIDLAASEHTEITHAIDNFGTNTGLLGNGAITDDKTPTLYGKAEANSLVYIHIRNILGMWELLSITADSSGNWNYTTDSLLSGNYEFQASNEQSYNEKKPLFKLKIIPPEDTTSLSIDYAWDDQGQVTGEIPNLGRTDDTLPQLHGRSEANALIYIEFGIKGSELQTGFSVRADHAGNWIWQPPQELKPAEWEFYATSGNNRSEVFSLNVNPSGEDIFGITHAIDNFGVYKGEVLNGAITDDLTPTLYGYAIPGSAIKIRYGLTGSTFKLSPEILVNSKGEWTWQVPTSALSLNLDKGWDFVIQSDNTEFTSVPFKLNLKNGSRPTIEGAIDDTGDSPVIIPHYGPTTDTLPTIYGKSEANAIVLVSYGNKKDGWIDGFSTTANSSGDWEWTVPQRLSTAVWSFRVKIDGVSWSANYAIDVFPDSLYSWDFNDGSLQGWEFLGIYTQAVAQSGVKKWVTNSNNKQLGANTEYGDGRDYSGDIAKTTIKLEAGKTYEFSFSAANFTLYGREPSIGLSIDGITVIANTAIGNSATLKGTYIATESKDFTLTLTNKTILGYGNDFAIDNIVVKEVDNKTLADVSKSIINLENSDNEVITLNLADVLSQGGKSLYIDDENHQLIINGTQQDVITLNNILPADVIDGEWAQQGGTVIVAGVEYNVFTHGDNYAEVLIQNGVNTEII